MTAPDLSRMRGQPKSPCHNCGHDNVWFNPACHHCGLCFWTNRVVCDCDKCGQR